MAGYSSNLAKKLSPTEQFPQQILPLLLLYNAQWWGYESLPAIALVVYNFAGINPGIMFPSRAELADLKEIDRDYIPSFQTMVKTMQEEKQKDEENVRKR